RIVDPRAVGRVAVRAVTGMDANSLSFFGRKTFQEQVVQVDETAQEPPCRIELDGKPPFREVDLERVSAFLQTASNLAFLLMQQSIKVLLTRIAGNSPLRIQEAQGRGRDNGLLD